MFTGPVTRRMPSVPGARLAALLLAVSIAGAAGYLGSGLSAWPSDIPTTDTVIKILGENEVCSLPHWPSINMSGWCGEVADIRCSFNTTECELTTKCTNLTSTERLI